MSINTKSLREQVYEHLKEKINAGEIRKGDLLDLGALSRELGISKTPLRDALLKLESDGFVEIMPRKGVKVKALNLKDIENLYQIIGALECAIISETANKLTENDIDKMAKLNEKMREALDDKNFDKYYELNLEFHNTYLLLSDNWEVLRIISISKQRLYDFPRRKEYLPEWEYNSLKEHAELVELFRKKDYQSAALFIKDVHWSFEVQKRFILKYYPDAK
ncbi:GntR family transcriptional regulator [Hippea alviniae]|uniref:GntR family transcriptional regulator n=1 Tax=Hippea alviniae TaxID=1279027 RepID=UPI0003B5C19F|nr:GntR family transcriptional regulator [Hippea alviniae]